MDKVNVHNLIKTIIIKLLFSSMAQVRGHDFYYSIYKSLFNLSGEFSFIRQSGYIIKINVEKKIKSYGKDK